MLGKRLLVSRQQRVRHAQGGACLKQKCYFRDEPMPKRSGSPVQDAMKPVLFKIERIHESPSQEE